MAVAVLFAPDATADFDALPLAMQGRVRGIIERLRAWPAVSGAKPLRYDWKGHYRIRAGDYRVILRSSHQTLS